MGGRRLVHTGLAVSPIAGAVLDRFGPARDIAADLVTSAGFVAAIAVVEVPGTGGAALLVALAYSLTRPLAGVLFVLIGGRLA